jgi:hypothetical protein
MHTYTGRNPVRRKLVCLLVFDQYPKALERLKATLQISNGVF